jgi:hypothetical protein
MVRLVLLLLLALAACNTKEDARPAGEAGAGAASASAVPSADVTPPPAPTSPIAVPPKVDYAAYTNPRFGFTVEYPTFIKLEPPPANNDGQTFTYFDKIAMKAWAIHSVPSDTIDTLAKNAAKEQLDLNDDPKHDPKRDPEHDPKKAITYQEKTKEGFVVSGTRGSKIFYRKEKLVKGVVYAVVVEYDASMKAEMDPIVTHIAESFIVMGKPTK